MKTFNQTKIILGTLVVLTMMSFKSETFSGTVKTGTYGICNCGEDTITKMELTLNEDFTFHYLNNENPKSLIDLHGSWMLHGKTILLKDYNAGALLQDKWKIDKNDKCLKTRKGLEWTRLCHIKSCQ